MCKICGCKDKNCGCDENICLKCGGCKKHGSCICSED